MISIVMTAWKRAALLENTLQSIERQKLDEPLEVIAVEDGDDNGETRAVCRARPHLVRYIQRKRRPELRYSNPAIPINLGLRAATGEYVILQNAECKHDAPDVIERLISPIRADDHVVTFAQVQALLPDGRFGAWYSHGLHRAVPYFFCGAATREAFYRIRGFEESFQFYGFDDDLGGWLLTMNGYRFLFTDVPVSHQWHEQTGAPGLESNYGRFNQIIREVMSGAPPISNRGRDWGVQESE